MTDPAPLPGLIRFGIYEVNLRAGELRRNGAKIKLQEQPFKVLAMLLDHPGEIVTREELQKALWSTDTFVDFEHGLNKAINKIREALGDSADNPRFVETLARRGYRFIAPIVGAGLVPAQGRPQGAPLRKWRVAALAAGVVLLIAGAIGYRHFRKPAAPPMRVLPFTTFPGQETDPSFSPDGNQIAFDWNGEKENNWDIYVKVVGTESVLRLTTNPAVDRAPAWSPDGRYIAFHRHTESEDGIYLVPALGGPERKLYSQRQGGLWGYHRLSWSPDGKYLAFPEHYSGEGRTRLSLLMVESLDTHPLTSPPLSPAFGDRYPTFSPDGKKVAFVRAAGVSTMDAYLVPIRGGEPKRLTYDNTYIFGLTWTPDGEHLVFSSERKGGQSGLWKLSLLGGEPEPLTVGSDWGTFPASSRDGHRLAYVQQSEDRNIWQFEVPRVPGRAKPSTRLIATSRNETGPQFSPDGKRIVFPSDRSGNGFEIWVTDSDGSNPVQLTHFGGPQAGTPRWSPDGRQVVFDCDGPGHFEIFKMSAEGGPPQRLTNGTSTSAVASWSRDGRWIYFASDRTGNWQVWKMPAEGGDAVQVTRGGGFAAFESYDGKTLYYAKGLTLPGLWKVPIAGGEETLVLEQLEPGHWGYWGLCRDGIYFYSSKSGSIQFFSFATHKTTNVATPDRPPHLGVPGFAVSPDGRKILLAQEDIVASDIMLVEDFRW